MNSSLPRAEDRRADAPQSIMSTSSPGRYGLEPATSVPMPRRALCIAPKASPTSRRRGTSGKVSSRSAIRASLPRPPPSRARDGGASVRQSSWKRWKRCGPAGAASLGEHGRGEDRCGGRAQGGTAGRRRQASRTSRWSSSAQARTARSSERLPRTEAPIATVGSARVARTRSTIQRPTRSDATKTSRTASWSSRTSSTGRRPRAAGAGGRPLVVDDLELVIQARIAERGLEEETVELRLGEREGALVLDRVLGRQQEERIRQRPGHAVDRHLALGHRLEQRGLRLRHRPVDLVDEDDVGEDRARPELEVARPLVVDGEARDVGRLEVRRALDPRRGAPEID